MSETVGQHVGHGAALVAEPRRWHPRWWTLGKREVEAAPRVEGTSGPLRCGPPESPSPQRFLVLFFFLWFHLSDKVTLELI